MKSFLDVWLNFCDYFLNKDSLISIYNLNYDDVQTEVIKALIEKGYLFETGYNLNQYENSIFRVEGQSR